MALDWLLSPSLSAFPLWEKPVLGSCCGLGASSGAPAEAWSMTKGDQATWGFGSLGTGNSVRVNLDMGTVKTVN